jgi:hypothetical protein
MVATIFYWVAVIGFCIIVGFGVYFVSNFIEVQMIKYNCDQMNGSLTYEGHQSNWLFVTDIWSCKTESQQCFNNSVEVNCSDIFDGLEKKMEDAAKWKY